MKDLKRITIKIGSNVLTRDDGTLDITRMSAIVDQTAELYRRGVEMIIVSSGAITSGRDAMRRFQAHHADARRNSPTDPVSTRQLYSAIGQAKLISYYYDLYNERGIACGQVLTMKENFSTRRHYLNQKHCMEVMLAAGVIPIVNENDTASVTELMFTDNDELSGLIASMMNAQALIILSNVDGVYDGDPALPGSRVITDIPAGTSIDASSFIQKRRSSFGRGGMGTKYRIAQKVADEGITVVIANGKRENILAEVTSGKRRIPFTMFAPAKRPLPSMKKWIAHSEGFAKGTVHVNEGAYKALTGPKASSLLPVGVTSVEGEWEKDDIVRIVSPSGEAFAVGRIGYDSEQAAALAGKQGSRPLIHYDYLYIE